MKNRPWESKIPQVPKFKDRKRLFIVLELVPDPTGQYATRYVVHGEQWLSREDEILYALKGYELELISVAT